VTKQFVPQRLELTLRALDRRLSTLERVVPKGTVLGSPGGGPGNLTPLTVQGIVYQDADGIYRGYYMSGGTIINDPVTSSDDGGAVFNDLLTTIPKGLVAYNQDIGTKQPILMQPGRGIIGQGSDYKATTVRTPTITAQPGFTPAGDGSGTLNSDVIRVQAPADDCLLFNVSADANLIADTACHGTGGTLRAYDTSFVNGLFYSINSNGPQWTLAHCIGRGKLGGRGAWRHELSSDYIVIGGRYEGGHDGYPAVIIAGGDGHMIKGPHITNQNGGGNSVFNCTNSEINAYFDSQGDVDDAAVIVVGGTGNKIMGWVKGGNGDGINCRVLLVDGSGINLNVPYLDVWVADAPHPNFAYLIEVNDIAARPGQIVLNSITSPAARPGTGQDTFAVAAGSERDAILVTAGNDPHLSNVVINDVYLDDGVSSPMGAGTAYHHSQGTAASTWTIPHNLGYFPNVLVISSGGDTVEGDVVQVDINNMTLHFSAAFTGDAYLS
jgi:hypothetical protein